MEKTRDYFSTLRWVKRERTEKEKRKLGTDDERNEKERLSWWKKLKERDHNSI